MEVEEVEQEVVVGVAVVVEDDLQKPSRGSVFLWGFGRRTYDCQTLYTINHQIDSTLQQIPLG